MKKRLDIITTRNISVGMENSLQISIRQLSGVQRRHVTILLRLRMCMCKKVQYNASAATDFASNAEKKIINHQVVNRLKPGLQKKTTKRIV